MTLPHKQNKRIAMIPQNNDLDLNKYKCYIYSETCFEQNYLAHM